MIDGKRRNQLKMEQKFNKYRMRMKKGKSNDDGYGKINTICKHLITRHDFKSNENLQLIRWQNYNGWKIPSGYYTCRRKQRSIKINFSYHTTQATT